MFLTQFKFLKLIIYFITSINWTIAINLSTFSFKIYWFSLSFKLKLNIMTSLKHHLNGIQPANVKIACMILICKSGAVNRT